MIASKLAALVLVSGCFYIDPINQRPSIDILPDSSAPVHRGDPVTLSAEANDPEGQAIDFQWLVYACTDATTPAGCDAGPIPGGTSLATDFTFTVPNTRDDGTPVQALRVILKATDTLGAAAKPDQELLISVVDAPPAITLQPKSKYNYVVGTPIEIDAQVSDHDDGAAAVAQLVWQVFSPATQPAYTLVPLPVTPGPCTTPTGDPCIDSAEVLVAMGSGAWTVQATATDPVGISTPVPLAIMVNADSPPCLEQWQPIAAPPGETLPMSDPTLFEVLYVADDLDPYPSNPSDPILGTTSFTWSLLPAGASSRQVLTGATGASVGLDPANYSLGDILELRVEIQDRNHTPIMCADADPTCSVISDPACIQRLTWRVEVR